MYQQIAHLYDWPGALDFAEKIAHRDLQLFEKLGIAPPAHILDLACGTGTLSIRLAQAGYRVTGIDLSEGMLTEAKRKHLTAETTLNIQWQAGDMRYFLIDEPVDAVVCHYDSLNHLSNETELRGTFIQIAQALKPNGVFLFDLNTLDNYQTFWNGEDAYEGPNYRLKTKASFNRDSDKAEAHFQVAEYNDAGQLKHYEETVYEQHFNETAVEKYLQAADFHEIRYTTFNPVPDIPEDFPLKTYWCCRKR